MDAYAFGVLMWEMVSRTLYFSEIAWASEISDRVVSGERPPVPSWVPASYTAVLERCWVRNCHLIVSHHKTPNPQERPDFSTIESDLSKLLQNHNQIERESGPAFAAHVLSLASDKSLKELMSISGNIFHPSNF